MCGLTLERYGNAPSNGTGKSTRAVPSTRALDARATATLRGGYLGCTHASAAATRVVLARHARAVIEAPRVTPHRTSVKPYQTDASLASCAKGRMRRRETGQRTS